MCASINYGVPRLAPSSSGRWRKLWSVLNLQVADLTAAHVSDLKRSSGISLSSRAVPHGAEPSLVRLDWISPTFQADNSSTTSGATAIGTDHSCISQGEHQHSCRSRAGRRDRGHRKIEQSRESPPRRPEGASPAAPENPGGGSTQRPFRPTCLSLRSSATRRTRQGTRRPASRGSSSSHSGTLLLDEGRPHRRLDHERVRGDRDRRRVPRKSPAPHRRRPHRSVAVAGAV